MIRYPIFLTALLMMAIPAPITSAADLATGPDYSFLWNQFNAIEILDGYALASSDFGVAVLQLDSASGTFSQVNQLQLGNQALELTVAGTLATVSTSAGILYFVDLSNLPELTLIGQTDLVTNVYDAVAVGNDLYLACGFDGLRHFSLQPGGVLQFVDSSLVPIHCVQVESQDTYLIVLDDYNGLLRYAPTSSGIGQVVDRIMVPRRAESFFQAGDTLVLALVDQALVYRATFLNHPELIDSAGFTIIPQRIFAIDSFIVAIDIGQERLEMMSTVNGGIISITFPPNLALQPLGTTCHFEGNPYVVFISGSLGLAGFDLKNLWYDPQPRRFFSHPGPIGGLAFNQGTLCTGGAQNPLETFRLDRSLKAVRDTALYSLIGVDAMVDGGDVLFTHTSIGNRTSALRISGASVTMLSSVTGTSLPTRGMKYYDYTPNDSVSLLLLIGDRTISLVTVSSDNTLHISADQTVMVPEQVSDAFVIDSFLIVTTTSQQIHTYLIYPSFFATHWWQGSIRQDLDHMQFVDKRHSPSGGWRSGIALAFDGNQMYEILVSPDGLPFIRYLGSLPIEVETSTFTPDALYGVGPQGVLILDIRQTVPSVITYGGYGGHDIAFGDSVLAVSDGTAVHLYSYRDGTMTPVEEPPTSIDASAFLQPNYPNPFNPRTRIDFTIPQSGRVEIAVYDILGRRVATLLEKVLPAGQHSIEWDGTDHSGERVASGVYFYRMSTLRTSETRKMVLLK